VVAIDKIDLQDANLDRVKSELAQEGLQPEEWGGTTQFAEVSAKTQVGLDGLLEKILLVADLELDPKANPNTDASGPIIESRLDVGRGPVATQRPSGASLETLFEQMQSGEVSDLNLVVKGDVVGSVEAVVSELSKFEHSEVRLNVIHQGVGAITQNDIMLASASDALIVGFN